MTVISLDGHITEDGKLDVRLPEGIPAGDVKVMLLMVDEVPGDLAPTFTPEELAELLKPEPVPFHLIETGIWKDKGITDSLEWLQHQREIRRERRKSRW